MAPSECTVLNSSNTNNDNIAMPTSPTTPDGDADSVIKTMNKVRAELQNEAADQDLQRNADINSGSECSEHESDVAIEEEDDAPVDVAVEKQKPEATTTDQPPAAATAVPAGAPSELLLTNVRVRIQKRPTISAHFYPTPTESSAINDSPDYEVLVLAELRLPLPVTLDSVRYALTQSELGDSDRDIFYPSWTKSLYITWNATGELETIESNAALTKALEKVEGLTLLLQECRNARYSRRAHHHNNYNNHKYSNRKAGGTRSPFTQFNTNMHSYRVDRPVYYDNNPHYYIHPAALAAAYGCVLPHQVQQNQNGNNANINGEGIAYMPAPFVVPFMYAPPQH